MENLKRALNKYYPDLDENKVDDILQNNKRSLFPANKYSRKNAERTAEELVRDFNYSKKENLPTRAAGSFIDNTDHSNDVKEKLLDSLKSGNIESENKVLADAQNSGKTSKVFKHSNENSLYEDVLNDFYKKNNSSLNNELNNILDNKPLTSRSFTEGKPDFSEILKNSIASPVTKTALLDNARSVDAVDEHVPARSILKKILKIDPTKTDGESRLATKEELSQLLPRIKTALPEINRGIPEGTGTPLSKLMSKLGSAGKKAASIAPALLKGLGIAGAAYGMYQGDVFAADPTGILQSDPAGQGSDTIPMTDKEKEEQRQWIKLKSILENR